MKATELGGQYPDGSQYAGPPASNPALRYDRETARFLTASGDMITDRQTRVNESKVGETRTFVRLWDLEGGEVAPYDARAGWRRGELVRGSQYQFVLTQIGPMFDPSNPYQSHWTRPAL